MRGYKTSAEFLNQMGYRGPNDPTIRKDQRYAKGAAMGRRDRAQGRAFDFRKGFQSESEREGYWSTRNPECYSHPQ